MHQGERVQAQHVPHRDLVAQGLGGRVGQEEREDAQEGRAAGGNAQGGRGGLEPERPHDQPRHDPADGPEDPHRRKLLFRALHLVEGDRVDEGEGRVVAERVAEEHPEEGPRAGDVRGLPEEHGAHQVQDAKHFLRREEAVGDHAHQERGHDRPPGHGGVGPADVGPREVEPLPEVRGEGHEPRPPDEELEEHHRRQARANRRGEGEFRQGVLRSWSGRGGASYRKPEVTTSRRDFQADGLP